MKTIAIVSLSLWCAAAAVGSATVADARVKTQLAGPYATCPGSYWTATLTECITTNYSQTMKFVTTPCNSGSCAGVFPDLDVEWVYAAGRQPTTLKSVCSPWNIYELGSCHC